MRNFNDDTKIFNQLDILKRTCKFCGHKVCIGKSIVDAKDKVICSWCGHSVYKDDKTEFIYKLKEKLNKKGENNNV